MTKTTLKDLKLTDKVVTDVDASTNVTVTSKYSTDPKVEIGIIKVDNSSTTLYAPARVTSDDLGLKTMAFKTMWTGTLAEYNALQTKDNDTLYFCKS